MGEGEDMTDEQWEAEVYRCDKVIAELCQAVIDDAYYIVRVQGQNGVQMSGIQVGSRVLVLITPEEIQEPIRHAGVTLQ